MGMGVFMNDYTKPVSRCNSTDIYQNSDWVCENIAQPVDAEGLSYWDCKNLDVATLLRMKALMTKVEIGIDLSVNGVNIIADPSTNGDAIAHVIEHIHHTRF
jgi:hypothetical protein